MSRTLSVSYFNRRRTVTLTADDTRALAKRAASVLRNAARQWGVGVSTLEWSLRDPAALLGSAAR